MTDQRSWYGSYIDQRIAIRAAAVVRKADRRIERDDVREIAGYQCVEGSRLCGVEPKEIVRIAVARIGR
jgi:hypothetical protein